MSMNIGNLMRAMLGDSQPTDVKALELRIGQIVRGVLLELLEDNEALIQVNGVQVRAKLDTELPVGRGTLMQVAQESTSGMIVLKALADPTAAPTDEALKDVAKSFGLPDQKWSFELMKGLKRDGYPIDKETANWFKQAVSAKPPGEDAQNWMNAAGVAFRRGLEPTESTIASLKAALYGAPLGEQLDNLEKQLASFLQRGQDAGASPKAMEAAQQVQKLLAQGQQLLSEGAQQLAEGAAGRMGADDAGGASGRAAQPGGSASTDAAAVAGRPTQEQTGQAAARSAANAAEAGGSVPGTDAQSKGTAAAEGGRVPPDARNESVAALAGKQGAAAQASDSAATRDRSAGNASPFNAVAAAGDESSGGAANEANAKAARSGSEGSWIGRFLDLLGANHERQAAQQLLSGDAPARNASEGAGQSADRAAAAPSESLKSALLTLANSNDAPPALREAAHGLAQQITGQQLLLAAERQNTAMMSHMTLFVPIKGQNGDTTASIHVQTRRGRKGEWDTDNCRLLFQLNMSHIGDTLVDVQVIDKVVSLRVLNDRPWVGELMESARSEAAEGFQSAGYQLLSLKTAPFPVMQAGEAESSEKGTAAVGGMPEQAVAAYAAKPYKGVDYRA
ncbi:hypothetical protein [Cohnella sp. AR92]|uniref:hypothetical protein n=1 Tax=Cohnella sp. AR92 TaxID=648716 RepID=UPI000F8E6984|nr:hypothetical protein [Cohnella sp. AR92]RUS46389.1 hypothetical protein ELR57_15060 [Cohnella sp. AR92]